MQTLDDVTTGATTAMDGEEELEGVWELTRRRSTGTATGDDRRRMHVRSRMVAKSV
jgi:hypothetical protein